MVVMWEVPRGFFKTTGMPGITSEIIEHLVSKPFLPILPSIRLLYGQKDT